MRLALLFLALAAGCIPLGGDKRLDDLAREAWANSGAPERFAGFPVRGVRCIGTPAAIGGSNVTAYVPWPWSEWDWMAGVIMRYELSKVAWQAHGLDADGSIRWYYPFVFLDGLLHLPPSELHSWWRVFGG